MSYKKSHAAAPEGVLEEAARGFWARLFEFIKFSHTLFALPFAFASATLAWMERQRSSEPDPGAGFWWIRLGLIVAAMVAARTAAMTFNRLADWNIDRRNPRTAGRHRLVSRPAAIAVCLSATALFLLICRLISPLAFQLAPAALATVFVYSFTKRFTHFSHFFLGFALALAPLGAWVAVADNLNSAVPWILAAAVVFWVAGFDLIYAMQDIEFDRREELCSLAARLGPVRTLALSRLLHTCMFFLILELGAAAGLGGVYYASLVPVAVILVWEHRTALRNTTESIQFAFFRANALISFILMFSIIIESLRN